MSSYLPSSVCRITRSIDPCSQPESNINLFSRGKLEDSTLNDASSRGANILHYIKFCFS